MTETKTYKKNTNTKTRHRQSASKTHCMLYYSKAGVQGFEILYWLSSCDDKDKDKETNLCILGVNIFQGGIFFRYEHFSGVNIWVSHSLLGIVCCYFSILGTLLVWEGRKCLLSAALHLNLSNEDAFWPKAAISTRSWCLFVCASSIPLKCCWVSRVVRRWHQLGEWIWFWLSFKLHHHHLRAREYTKKLKMTLAWSILDWTNCSSPINKKLKFNQTLLHMYIHPHYQTLFNATLHIHFPHIHYIGFLVHTVHKIYNDDMIHLIPQQHVNYETSQELRMLSSVTINCQGTKIIINPGSQLSVL